MKDALKESNKMDPRLYELFKKAVTSYANFMERKAEPMPKASGEVITWKRKVSVKDGTC
jgi:hypothetical protein